MRVGRAGPTRQVPPGLRSWVERLVAAWQRTPSRDPSTLRSSRKRNSRAAQDDKSESASSKLRHYSRFRFSRPWRDLFSPDSLSRHLSAGRQSRPALSVPGYSQSRLAALISGMIRDVWVFLPNSNRLQTVISKGVSESRAFISGRVALRDLLFSCQNTRSLAPDSGAEDGAASLTGVRDDEFLKMRVILVS